MVKFSTILVLLAVFSGMAHAAINVESVTTTAVVNTLAVDQLDDSSSIAKYIFHDAAAHQVATGSYCLRVNSTLVISTTDYSQCATLDMRADLSGPSGTVCLTNRVEKTVQNRDVASGQYQCAHRQAVRAAAYCMVGLIRNQIESWERNCRHPYITGPYYSDQVCTTPRRYCEPPVVYTTPRRYCEPPVVVIESHFGGGRSRFPVNIIIPVQPQGCRDDRRGGYRHYGR
ncbi:MAG: hypothetical protein WCO52_00390 [bacterium]